MIRDRASFRLPSVGWLLAAAALGCATGPEPPPTEHDHDGWSITAWGDRFEVYPEAESLHAGETTTVHTHVTRLGGFAPLTDGTVELVLAGPDGDETFSATAAASPGIFAVEVTPSRSGERDFLIRVRDDGGTDEIRGGRLFVGDEESEGRLVLAPAPKGGLVAAEGLSLLKEQQWNGGFGTAWVRSGRLAGSVHGLATIRPTAGGTATLTAPVDGVVRAPSTKSWPHVGMAIAGGEAFLELVPLVAANRSLSGLESDVETIDSELEIARERLTRLEELHALDAASRREVDEARVRVATLASRHAAAGRDLEGARSARGGSTWEHGLALRAPFGGEIASVDTTPGATVAAGTALARLVDPDVMWIEVVVAPADARRIAADGVRGIVLSDAESRPLRIEDGLRLVAIAPEVNPRTGTVAVLLEAARGDGGPTFGTTMDGLILGSTEREGIVLPATAIIDDGGVPVVYLQLAGESFVRQPVRIVERQGELVLVDGLVPGQRLVTLGGDSIRRASLTATGDAHGHVH